MLKTPKVVLLCLLVLSFSAVAFAQSTTTGAIGGVVTNPNKEVVPGAAVTVKNNGTNKEDTATTDDTGRFKVANLQPGSYSVTVNSSGFSPMTSENVVVEIGRETNLEVALSVGPVTGTVDVSAEAPVINTTQQDFSSNINQTSINELPINGRRWSNFALLTPGAVPDGTFGLISFRGISGLLNNNTIDGAHQLLDQPGCDSRVSSQYFQLLSRVRTFRGRRGQRDHEERHERFSRRCFLLPTQQQVGRT
jgi:hypothetical protein